MPAGSCLGATAQCPAGARRGEPASGLPFCLGCRAGRLLRRPCPWSWLSRGPGSEMEKPDREPKARSRPCGLSRENWRDRPTAAPTLPAASTPGRPPSRRPGGHVQGCLFLFGRKANLLRFPGFVLVLRGFRVSITELPKVWDQHRNGSPYTRPGEAWPAGVVPLPFPPVTWSVVSNLPLRLRG